MLQIEKGQVSIIIEVMVYEDDEVVRIQRVSNSWESAEEDLYKLQRAVKRIEREEIIKE